ncbi:hypothetical protein [Mariniphaga sp.]|uniref:hypothetical protein n=1 Tax=Mariniphaga sp. TaxID=1954475 RepID=UPI003567CFE3
MRYKIFLVAGAVIFFNLLYNNATGQNIQEPEEIAPAEIKGLFIGGQASTNGLGFNLRYVFGKRLTLKSGVESLNLNYSFQFDEQDISYKADFNYKTGGIFLMADYFYTNSLYITGGAIFNDFQPKLEGVANSDMQYGDITIPASKVGGFNMQIEPDLKISPYAGIGFRKFMGKKKMVTYNFETGLYYIGPPHINIDATGLLAPTANPAHGKQQYLENQFSVYKYYPVVKFAIAIRLF